MVTSHLPGRTIVIANKLGNEAKWSMFSSPIKIIIATLKWQFLEGVCEEISCVDVYELG